MKILQLHNSYIYKGGEDVVVELEKNLLTEYGHSVFQLKRENKKEIRNFVDKFTIAKNLSYSNYSKELVDKEIKKIRPNLVHVHNFFPLWTTSIFDACIDNNIPIVEEGVIPDNISSYLIDIVGDIFLSDLVSEGNVIEIQINPNRSSVTVLLFICYFKMKYMPVWMS